MFLVIALEFLKKLIKKIIQKFRQVLNNNRESLDESKNFDEIKNVSIRVFTLFVSKDVSNDQIKNELKS